VRRLAIAFCLVTGLLAQGFALAGQMVAFAQGGDAIHAAMHLESVAHHHGQDGSIHKDASRKSLKHLQADCCVQLAAVLPEGTPAVPAVPLDRSRIDTGVDERDSPFLEGLKRPPR
jgi:hypothetical protein